MYDMTCIFQWKDEVGIKVDLQPRNSTVPRILKLDPPISDSLGDTEYAVKGLLARLLWRVCLVTLATEFRLGVDSKSKSTRPTPLMYSRW